jgi:hypothetical protein
VKQGGEKDHQGEQQPEHRRRHDKEIRGDDLAGVIR